MARVYHLTVVSIVVLALVITSVGLSHAMFGDKIVGAWKSQPYTLGGMTVQDVTTFKPDGTFHITSTNNMGYNSYSEGRYEVIWQSGVIRFYLTDYSPKQTATGPIYMPAHWTHQFKFDGDSLYCKSLVCLPGTFCGWVKYERIL